LKSDKLIKEMKKILQMFPHGVLMASKNCKPTKDHHFTNEMFEKDICKIRHKLQELDAVTVEFKIENQISKKEPEKIKLLKFLHERQNLIKREHSIDEIDVLLSEKMELDGQQNLEENIIERRDELEAVVKQKSFRIKSLEVEWEGEPCYLHVFIDTTNIVKLEEAKNNIK
jgi:hypothetical protein